MLRLVGIYRFLGTQEGLCSFGCDEQNFPYCIMTGFASIVDKLKRLSLY
jgi:hypothetical protein